MTIDNYGTDGRTEENQQFPVFLGDAGKEEEASRTLAKAAYDSGGVRCDDGNQKGFPKEKFLAHLEIAAIQRGTWIEDINALAYKLKARGGAENEIYLSKDGRSVIKLNRFTMLDEQHGIWEFVDRINSHNEFERCAPYSVLGFAEDSEGNVCVVLEQPIIKGTEASQDEIDAFLTEVGFEKKPLSDGELGWSNGTYEIWDADPANVLKDAGGCLYFIDAVINNVVRINQHRNQYNIF